MRGVAHFVLPVFQFLGPCRQAPSTSQMSHGQYYGYYRAILRIDIGFYIVIISLKSVSRIHILYLADQNVGRNSHDLRAHLRFESIRDDLSKRLGWPVPRSATPSGEGRGVGGGTAKHQGP